MSENNCNKYTFEMIAQKLKGYADLQRRAKILEFEISNYDEVVTSDDIIDSMTFNRTIGDSSGAGHSSQIINRTADIAISHEERTAGLNRKYKQELELDLRSIRMEMLRIETYVGLLDKKYSKVLVMLYIDCITFVKTSEQLKISMDTVRNYRKTGIKHLVEMYNSILR